jgi:hypothetical protein
MKLNLNLKGQAAEPVAAAPLRPAEAFIGNKTRHAVKCLDEALDRIEEAYRCFLDCARELHEQAMPLETFRNKIVDVIGAEARTPDVEAKIDTAKLEADIADVAEARIEREQPQ